MGAPVTSPHGSRRPHPGDLAAAAAATPAQAAASQAASQAAARSVSAIAVNQVAQVLGSLLFVALIPRLLGPQVYGQLAFAFALITIFQMCGELGYQEIFSRFLPEVRQRYGEGAMGPLVYGLFSFRAVAGAALGVCSVLLAQLAADWLTPQHAALIGLSVTARVWSMGPFPLLLGLGATYKWSVETTWRQLVVTFLLLALVRTPSLTMTLVAMAVHEVMFLLLGLWWVREWIIPARHKAPGARDEGQAGGQGSGGAGERGEARRIPTLPAEFHLRRLLRFGFIFSLANLALVVMFRISPITVELLTGQHAETGYFDLALGGLLLIYTVLGQVAYAFVPILTQLHLSHQAAEADQWLGRVVRSSTVLIGLATGGMWAVAAPIAPLLFGAGFEPAADTLRMMAFGLLPLPLAWAGVTLTAVEKRPHRKLWAALLGLGIFLLGAYALRASGSPGIALAFGLALLGYALGYGRSVLHAMRAGGAGWAAALLATLVFAPLFFTGVSSLPAGLLTWLALAGLYLALMFVFRVASPEDLRPMARAFKRR